MNTPMGAPKPRERRFSELQLHDILETVPDAVVVTHNDGRILFANVQAGALFGYTREELCKLTIEELIPARFRHSHAAHRGRYHEEPAARTMGTRDMELYGLRKNGEEFAADVSISPVRTPQGVMAIAAVRDMTARNEAEKALRNANVAAEAARRELSAFSESVAHDLRAPVRRQDLLATMLKQDFAHLLPQPAIDQLDAISATSKRMTQIIDGLMTLARSTSAELTYEEVDLAVVAREVLEELRRTSPERHVEFIVPIEAKIRADARLLRVVLENLLRNAWKFTAKRATARIEFGERTTEGERTFFVRDDGAGFDMRHAGNLFRAFRRLHPTSDFEGTGIGLSTVDRILRRHGGRIWADAATDRGATFLFTIGDRRE